MNFPNSIFKNYSERVISELTLLKRFKIQEPVSWKLDWNEIRSVKLVGKKKKNWDIIPVFKTLLELRKSPAVYFFTIDPQNAERVYQQFVIGKAKSSEIRKSAGLKDKLFSNISHVPKIFKQGATMYVGSVKNGLHGRLIQHLGMGSSGRTGALYLTTILEGLSTVPEIKFNYCVIEDRYRGLTEHIECVLYDELKPFIGKRAIRLES